MKLTRLLFSSLFVVILITTSLPQGIPNLDFKNLVFQAEEDLSIRTEARQLALKKGLPLSIYLEEGVYIEAIGVVNEQPVYALYKNLAHPLLDGEALFFSEIEQRFELSDARVNYGAGNVTNRTLGYPQIDPTLKERAAAFLMIGDSDNDGVMTFDATTGDLIDANFIGPDPTNLSTPIQARLTPWGTVTVSDQLEDGLQEYDTLGNYIGWFAPAGGPNNDILDNVRGHGITPTGNVYSTSASGLNSDAIAEFDDQGNYLGNIIGPAATSDSPWDVIFRTSDILVDASTSDNIARYDLSGTYLDDLATGFSLPEQMIELDNGDIALAEFSGGTRGSGIQLFASDGTFLMLLDGVTGNRGVWKLGNGNFLTTNGSGVHEIDAATGNLVETKVAGISSRFISPYDRSIVPVELTSFAANVVDGIVHLNWATATELNNSGFEVQRSTDGIQFNKIGFVQGHGTTSETQQYSFVDNVNSGSYYYRLKQVDFNGSFEYSKTVEVDLGIPTEYSVSQNYPNPFNPSTNIEFALPVDAKVVVKVFNLLGQEVSTLTNKNFTAGTHTLNFNANNLSGGVYIYSINASGIDGSNYISTMKMTLLK